MNDHYGLLCQYADDVRQEATGKGILIGLYQGNMNVSGTLPVTLPQLVVIANFIIGPSAMPISHLKVTIHQDDKVLFDWESPNPVFGEAGPNADGEDPKILQLNAVLRPFAIEREGRLSVMAVINGKHSLRGNSLSIRQQGSNGST
jgi:hypothetical protein